MTDDGLRFTFRNYSTLFLMTAAIAAPLQLISAYLFRDVIEVREIHDAIRALPEGEALLGVDAGRLGVAATALALTWILVALSVPVLLSGARRVAADDALGRLPAVGSALAAGLRTPALPRPSRPLLVPAAAALASWALLYGAASLLVELVTDPAAWAAAGLARALPFAAALPLVMGPAGWASRAAKGHPQGEPTSKR